MKPSLRGFFLSSTFLSLGLAPLAVPTTALHAQANPAQLTSVLGQMDAAAAKFHSAQADVRYDIYTEVVHDHNIQTGSLYIERDGGTYKMAAIVYNVGANGQQIKPATNIVQFNGSTLRSYAPGNNQVDTFQAGANQSKAQTYLTLGFGGSGKDLQRAWNITDKGPATINGVKTEQLDLVSKDPSVRNTFSHITIWVDPVRDVSLKQIFYAPNGDTRTADYSNIRLNGKIDTKPYDIPKNATVVNH